MVRGVLTCVLAVAGCGAFAPPRRVGRASTSVEGMFDFITDAFKNEAFDDRRAKASHILVKTEAEAADIAGQIAGGTIAFKDAASQFSTCPSARSGGSLGSFEPGKMARRRVVIGSFEPFPFRAPTRPRSRARAQVKEFDDVCFDESVEVGSVVGPVKTQFGYHLVLVEERFVNQERTEGSSVF